MTSTAACLQQMGHTDPRPAHAVDDGDTLSAVVRADVANRPAAEAA